MNETAAAALVTLVILVMITAVFVVSLGDASARYDHVKDEDR